jgi:hypothetical protein
MMMNTEIGGLADAIRLVIRFAQVSAKGRDTRDEAYKLAAESTENYYSEQEVILHKKALLWDRLSERTAIQLDAILERLGLTVDEVTVPALEEIYAR